MAPHSSPLAWKIPWLEEPGGLQSMGLLRVRHDWMTSLSLFIFLHWRRKWQPTPVFLPGESQGRGSLVGCHLWGRTESDTTDGLSSSSSSSRPSCTYTSLLTFQMSRLHTKTSYRKSISLGCIWKEQVIMVDFFDCSFQFCFLYTRFMQWILWNFVFVLLKCR